MDSETYMFGHMQGMRLGEAVGKEQLTVAEQVIEVLHQIIADQAIQLTAYQIAKDNLELRAAEAIGWTIKEASGWQVY